MEIVFIGGFAILAVVFIVFHYSRSNSLLHGWAEKTTPRTRPSTTSPWKTPREGSGKVGFGAEDGYLDC